MEVEPTHRLEDDRGYWRVYGFEKDPPDGSAPLEYRFRFNDDLLTEIRFPRQFTELYPADILAELLRSLGDADVDKSEKSAFSRSFNQRLVTSLPGRKELVEALGDPTGYDEILAEGGVGVVYRYTIMTSTTGEKREKRHSYGHFLFRSDGSLEKVDAGIGDHELCFTIPERLPDDDAEHCYPDNN
ncbi:MAG: hypothetical protein GY835_26595 [bacterium]|nr:hypothetical protein [bacterium]